MMALHDTVVEIYYEDAWHDITNYVRTSNSIRLTRGTTRLPARGVSDPGEAVFSLENADGRFSTRNHLSPLFGLVGVGTLVRISVVVDNVTHVRFSGEITKFTNHASMSGTDVYVDVVASEPQRRLARLGVQESAMTQGMLDPGTATSTDYSAYTQGFWPMEEGQTSRVVNDSWGARIGNAGPMTITGGQTGATLSTGWLGTKPLPQLGTATASALIKDADPAGESWTIWFVTDILDGLSADTPLVDVWTAAGLHLRVTLTTSPSWKVEVWDEKNTLVCSENMPTYMVGKVKFGVYLKRSGTTVSCGFEWQWQDNNPLRYYYSSTPRTFTSAIAPGDISSISINGTGSGVSEVPLGQVTILDGYFNVTHAGWLFNGLYAERFDYRWRNIRFHAGLPDSDYNVYYLGNDIIMLGASAPGTVIDSMEELCSVDGFVTGARESFNLYLRSHAVRSCSGELVLDYTGGHIMALDTQEDDTCTTNVAKVTRVNGATAVARISGGARGVDMVGEHSVSNDSGCYTDEQALSRAWWEVYTGTVDEPTLRAVTVSMNTDEDLVNRVLTGGLVAISEGVWVAETGPVDIFSALRIDNPPVWLGPGPLRFNITGYREDIGRSTWTITFTGEPQSAHDYAWLELEDYTTYGEARPDSEGSTLDSAVGLADLSIGVSLVDAVRDRWVTTAEDASAFPFDITVGGEVMTVSGITGLASPQTFTLSARGVGGYTAEHEAGEPVHLHIPQRIALP